MTPKETLVHCQKIMESKAEDYTGKSSVTMADYYPRGIATIHDIMHAKMLRIKSVMEQMETRDSTNFESIQDSCVDLINYTTFFVAYMDGDIPGQNSDNDMFNKIGVKK
jgi:hypothetical protein